MALNPDNSDDIAVVGSPSSNTELTLDVLQDASYERVVGSLLALEGTQDGHALTIIGQVTSLELSNKWHEDSVFRNLLKRTGEIPPITNKQDTRTAKFSVGATFQQGQQGWEPGVLGMVPSTGSRIRRVTQKLLSDLLRLYKDELFYVGRAYGNNVMYPMWFKHFGSGAQGVGEAYHLGIFGRTGSGKSGLAKMMLLAYARHPELGILVIDPQGEFAVEMSGTSVGKQELPLRSTLSAMGRPVQTFPISQLQLTGWELFEEILLHLRFLERVGIPAASEDNARKASEVIRRTMETKKVKLAEADVDETLKIALDALSVPQQAQEVYSTQSRAQQLITFIVNMRGNPEQFADARKRWDRILQLFRSGPGKRQVYGIVQDLLGSSGAPGAPRPLVVIDLSESGNREVWFEDLERRILIDLLRAIIASSAGNLRTGQSANVLVVLDEAHRHAPSTRGLEGYSLQLQNLLRRATRETRKYGIGWMFISQTLGGLDQEILNQMRIQFFGFGLGLGEELRKLKEFAGGDERSMDLYSSFRDPQAFPSKELMEFPFMGVGPISPLSFAGKPVFFTAFTVAQEYLAANGLPGGAARATPARSRGPSS